MRAVAALLAWAVCAAAPARAQGLLDAGPDARVDAGPDARVDAGDDRWLNRQLRQPEAKVLAAAYPSVERVLLGQPFSLVVVISSDTGDHLQAELPSSLSLGPNFRLGRRFRETRVRPDGTSAVEIQVEITAWRVGQLAIPSIPVEVPRRGALETVYTAPARIEVMSVARDESADIRDHLEPVAVVRRDFFWLYVLAGLGAVTGVAAPALALVRRRRARPPGPRGPRVQPVAPESPAARAIAALREIADAGALEGDDPGMAVLHMAEIARDYLGRRFGFAARDATTREVIEAIDRSAPELATLTREAIQPWLEGCDLVKFADARVTVAEAVQVYADAVAFISRT